MSTSPRTPFTPAEWGAIALIILVWGLNNAAAKIATEALPPLFMGGMRFLIALVLLIPFLKPPWPPWRQLLPLVLLAGPLHFGLVYVAFAMVHNLSPIVVALQLWIPMTALVAWLMLGDRNLSELQALAARIAEEGSRVQYRAADPTRQASTDMLVTHTQDAYGRIDLLLNLGTPPRKVLAGRAGIGRRSATLPAQLPTHPTHSLS